MFLHRSSWALAAGPPHLLHWTDTAVPAAHGRGKRERERLVFSLNQVSHLVQPGSGNAAILIRPKSAQQPKWAVLPSPCRFHLSWPSSLHSCTNAGDGLGEEVGMSIWGLGEEGIISTLSLTVKMACSQVATWILVPAGEEAGPLYSVALKVHAYSEDS